MEFIIINIKVNESNLFSKHFQRIFSFSVQTKSWFEQEPEPALPNYDDEEQQRMSKLNRNDVIKKHFCRFS